MGKLYEQLLKDVRFQEGLKACINCGTCTAICPAAEFYNYEPRSIIDIIQLKNDKRIEELLKGDEIWYCGECMSCKTRCPRDNAPGLVIIALRSLSIDLGYFVESEKGRQQLAIKRMVGESILNTGYCVYVDHVDLDKFPEQGPVWAWYKKNLSSMLERLGGNYKKKGTGVLRLIDDETLKEIHKIFEVTKGLERYEKIEDFSKQKAKQMGLELKESGLDNEYFNNTYTANNQNHTRE
jgi:heterodisulfide reductase subunit C